MKPLTRIKFIQLCISLFFLQSAFSQPVISSFSPKSGPIGSVVTISGSGFNNVPANNIVYFGTVKSNVTSSNSNSLQVTVPAGASYEPITVTTGSLTAYSTIPFIVTFPGAGSVFPPDIYNTEIDEEIDSSETDNGYAYFTHLTVVDLDNDGKADMISSNAYPKTISVLRNTSVVGKITFEKHKEFSALDGPYEITHADFDGDGKQDIIVVCPKTVSIFKNSSTNGYIDLSTRVDISLPASGYTNIAVNDIDNDGKPDFVVTGHNTQNILLFRNTSNTNNITFDQPVTIPVSYGYESVALKDVDGDSKPDLIVNFVRYPDGNIQIAKNISTSGNIAFTSLQAFSTIKGANDIDLGDFDGDNKPDVATPDNQSGNFSVLQNTSTNGSINFLENQDFYVGIFPQRLAIGDIDGDGKPDVAVSDNNYIGYTISIYKNLSSGNSIDFTPKLDIHGNASDDLVVADMDGDGQPEIEVGGTEYSLICVFTSCPQGTITQQPTDSLVCISGDAAFSVVTTDTTAKYQWQMQKGNEWTDLSENSVYNGVTKKNLQITGADTSMNNFKYRCLLISKCATRISDTATLYVRYPSPPGIAISTNDTIICPNTKTTFTASSTNGGSNPVYQWKKNGINVGSNQNIYTDSLLKDGDILTCTITSNAACLSSNTGTSNGITMHIINTQTLPQVSIGTASATVCEGTMVSFTATAINAGNNPIYSWKKNGSPVGSNTNVYADSNLNTNDTIACTVTTSFACSIATATSNSIVMTVRPTITPSIHIAVSQNNICPNTNVVFTGNITNEGTEPVFIWKKNGIIVGSNISTYSDDSIQEGDSIICLLQSNATGCLATNTATSNTVYMHLVSGLPAPVDLGPDKGICSGASVTLDAGAGYSSYLWQDGSANSKLPVSTAGLYSVTTTDACENISRDTIVITQLNSPSHFLPADTSLCVYDHIIIQPQKSFVQYLWNNNATTASIDINTAGTYWLRVTDENYCTGSDSIYIASKDCMNGIFVPSAFTPNGDGKNDLFKPLVFGQIHQYDFRVYNRYGETIFHTTEPGKGWDGKYNGKTQDANVFVWICIYQVNNDPVARKSGTVTILH